MELSLRSHTDLTNSSMRKPVTGAAPSTTSLLSMLSTHETPKSQRPQPSNDSPNCVSLPVEQDDHDYIGAKSPMEDVGGFYEEATWRMYQRIQTARQEVAQNHYLPPAAQLAKDAMAGGRRLQPRNVGGYLPSPSFHDDWMAHIDSELEDESEEEEDDGIFEMDDL